MATRDINAEIQSRVEAFATELSGLIREAALESVQDALSGGAAKPRSTGRKKAAGRKKAGGRKTTTSRKAVKRAAGGRRIRRSEEDLANLGGLVLAHVKANAGDRLEQIGVALGIDTAELKRPIANLLDAKQLKTTGQRRGTKYFTGRAKPVAKKAKAK